MRIEFSHGACDLVSDGEGGIEGFVWILEDHLEVADEGGVSCADAEVANVLIVERDGAAGRFFESEYEFCEGCFSATGFADDGDDLSFIDTEADVVIGFDGFCF